MNHNTPVTIDGYFKQLQTVCDQHNELQQQVMPKVTCTCGDRQALADMHKCLYCHVYYCTTCAERHFGKTIEEWRAENPNPTVEELGR